MKKKLSCGIRIQFFYYQELGPESVPDQLIYEDQYECRLNYSIKNK